MTGLMRVRFVLDQQESRGVETEGLWAESVAGNRYRLRNVPFCAFGVSAEDIVFAEERDGQLFFRDVSIRAGHSTYRIYVTNPAEFERWWSPLAAIGCTFEEGTMMAVDVPPRADIYAAYALLEAGVEAGIWDFEEGHCGHPLRDEPDETAR